MIQLEEYKCEVLIIGAGPAGLTAGIYCGRSNRDTIILNGKEPSALLKTKEISNWPGESNISGKDLLEKFRKHTESYETVRVIDGDVISLMLGMGTNMVSTRNANIASDVIIIATGMGQRKEIIKNESKMIGFGVSYCALCDGPLYRGKDIYLYGEDEEVIEDALVLDQMGCKVHIITNKSVNELPEKINEVIEKGIEVLENMEVVEAIPNAEGIIEKIKVKPAGKKQVNEEELKEYELSCLFIFSHVPSNSIFKKAGIKLDENRNIKVDENQQTNIPSVYAAGDVTGGLFQVVFAAAEGARAAINALKYLISLKKE